MFGLSLTDLFSDYSPSTIYVNLGYKLNPTISHTLINSIPNQVITQLICEFFCDVDFCNVIYLYMLLDTFVCCYVLTLNKKNLLICGVFLTDWKLESKSEVSDIYLSFSFQIYAFCYTRASASVVLVLVNFEKL